MSQILTARHIIRDPARIMCNYARKGLDIQCKMEYYHFDVNVKVEQVL